MWCGQNDDWVVERKMAESRRKRVVMIAILVAIGATFLLLSGCVSGAEVKNARMTWDEASADGVVTPGEIENVDEAFADLGERVAIRKRQAETGDWQSLLIEGGLAAATALAGAYGVNRHRDRKRKKRGERTDVPKAPSTT